MCEAFFFFKHELKTDLVDEKIFALTSFKPTKVGYLIDQFKHNFEILPVWNNISTTYIF